MILVVTNADTEILALRSVIEALPEDFPSVRAFNPAVFGGLPQLESVSVVAVRLLGGRRAWEPHLDELHQLCIERRIPFLAFGGEAMPDADMTSMSTVPATQVRKAFDYLATGGLANIENFLRYIADELLGCDFGHIQPRSIPAEGIFRQTSEMAPDDARPLIAVVFYRAHLLSGNTQFVDDLCDAIERRGARAMAVYCYSLRPGADCHSRAIDVLADARVDAVITTVLAMGAAIEIEGEEGWDASALAALDVPVVQAIAATQSEQLWQDSSAGLAPIDVAMAVAIPEFDGRIISAPFSFKETVDSGDSLGSPVFAYRTSPNRTDRVAGVALRLAQLGHTPNIEKRVAIVLSAYPTKRSRIGNAVALDTPASVMDLLQRLTADGYSVGPIPETGDDLMARLIATFSYERDALSTNQLRSVPGRWPGEAYSQWFAGLPEHVRNEMVETWGTPPGDVYHHEGDLLFPGIQFGNVLVAIQPPRGFGENPIAVYHSPDLPPTHHYLAFYRWLETGWNADAIIHMGKHGTLEWLPGKGVGLSAGCYPDIALGDLPLIYPFVVNDPGEGIQAKRRAHAVVVDHLLPPMTRAETYGETAQLESLLDEYAQVASLDPSKLGAIRQKVWNMLVESDIHRDLNLSQIPPGDEFDKVVLHVDGYLCELKDAQIRGGLHTLGRPPQGNKELDLVLSITRLPQGDVPALRSTQGLDRHAVDQVEAECRQILGQLQKRDWNYEGADPTLQWVSRRLIPALRRTGDEITNIGNALDGRFVASGPSGAPTRGMAHVLPTGRNFYSVDPKAIPSQLAWDVGGKLADALIAKSLDDEGRYPRSVGLVVWGTATMRTGGDDVAEALALIGVRPVWGSSGRVVGLQVIPIEQLGRPRIDVTLRISGFFRDAFPHLIALVDEAVELVANMGERDEDNYIVANGVDDPRIFGSKPGAYGSGILPLIESGEWESDDDMAAVYMSWSGYSYGRAGMGTPAPDAMRRRFGAIDAAVKNQDNREHDIFDSDDYMQDHGGMIATIRALSGKDPKAWFGDSANPSNPRVRTLAEEAARVVRTRVLNPKWINAMCEHGYKGAFEMAATVDYLFGYDATAHVVEDWMYEKVTQAYVANADVRKLFEQSNPWALRSIAERLLEANDRNLWDASQEALSTLRSALLEAEGWEESR